MAIIQRGECLKEEKLKEQNEAVEKNVVRKILQAFDEPAVREQFKDLIVYYKKRLYSDGRLFCPDIFLWKEDLGVILVEVKAWDKNFIFKEGWENLRRERSLPSTQVNTYKNLILNLGIKPVDGVLAFPNLSIKDIEDFPPEVKTYFEQLKETKILFKEDFGNKELLRKKILSGIYRFHDAIPLEEIKRNMQKFRSIFFPELIVPFKGSVLDYLQEEASYFLTKEPKNRIKGLRDCNVISGCAGTGKSIVVVSAAIRKALEYYQYKEEGKKILLLVYNKEFYKKLKEDVDYIIKERNLPKQIKNFIDIFTIHAFAKKLLELNNDNFVPTKEKDAVDRALELLEQDKLIIPEQIKPDVLLVDEAQDIRKHWFKLIHAIVKPETIIGFAIDKVQRLYPGTEWKTWKEVGFNAKGRSKVLKKIYRSASGIFLLGLEFLKRDAEYFRELSKLEGSWVGKELEPVKEKGKIAFFGEDRDFKKTLKLIEKLLTRYKPEDIMVITFFNKKLERLKSLIKEKLAPYRDKIKVVTYYSSKGLERKAVIIHDFDNLFHKVKNKQEERMRRSLGFVAITRAEEELYFFGDTNKGPLKELKEIVDKMKLKI